MKNVYILRGGDKFYKVGVAVNVSSRISSIKTSNPFKVELVASRFLEDAESVEQELHIKLREYQTNAQNEWFEMKPAQVLELCVLLGSYRQPKFLGRQVTTETLLARLDLEHDEIKSQIRSTIVGLDTLSSRIKALEKSGGSVPVTYFDKVQGEPESPIHAGQDLSGTDSNTSNQPVGDVLEDLAYQVCLDAGKASSSLLQMRLSIGYARAARLINTLERKGLVGPLNGASPREVFGSTEAGLSNADKGGYPASTFTPTDSSITV